MTPSRPKPNSTNEKSRAAPSRDQTPLQEHLLERLDQLVQRRNEFASQVSDEGRPFLGLIHRAIFAAYVDCLEEGVGDEALSILREENIAAAA